MNEDQEFQEYESFSKRMEETFPKMFSKKYGGFATGKGWWPLLEKLCHVIQRHIDHVNNSRARLLESNPHNHKIPDEVPQVVIEQIKEKFGTLRFYYQGGDEYIQGAVWLAESLTDQLCETCGGIGTRRPGGWIRTLCDVHEAEHQKKLLNQEEQYAKDNGLEL